MRSQTNPSNKDQPRFEWLDWLKGISILLIILNHFAEEIFGGPHLGNIHSGWPPLAERVAQWSLLPISRFGDVLANGTRYVGWLGEQSVSFFIILSGIGLTLSVSRKGDSLDFRQYFISRVARIYPIWIVAHLLFLLPPALLGWRVSLGHPEFYLSLLGIRINHHQIYYGIPAWWFVSLVLQLYLVFPLMYFSFRRLGRNTALIAFCSLGLLLRGIGIYALEDNLDAWARGTIFVTRMAEFAFGIWFGAALFEKREQSLSFWRKGSWLGICIVLWGVGTVLGLTKSGMIAFPLVTGVAGFLFFYGVMSGIGARVGRGLDPVLSWFGKHSLSLFLVNHQITYVLLRNQTGADVFPRVLIRFALILLLVVVAAIVLEKTTKLLTDWLSLFAKRYGWVRTIGTAAASVTAVVLLIVPIELSIRKNSPQDVPDFGWSERPSLQPDAKLGFRLKSSSRTRLRWESYDYEVVGNAAGFPGPDFEWQKPPNTFRIMTLGDAYTSAEGVDTDRSWPRLLESQLEPCCSQQSQVEVVNFGITGFGPNQYATITEDFATRLTPDMIIIGFFTNDFWDVQVSADEFRDMIGFNRLPVDHWLGVITGRHLFRYLRGNLLEATFETLTSKPAPHTRFFLQQDAMDPDQIEELLKGQSLVRDCFQRIKRVAEAIDAKVLVMAIPAPIQVVDREQLGFLRPAVDWNTDHLDMDQPQRLAKEVADESGFAFYDLRPALKAVKDQHPYQSHNLHWTETGHETAAATMVEIVHPSIVRADCDCPSPSNSK